MSIPIVQTGNHEPATEAMAWKWLEEFYGNSLVHSRPSISNETHQLLYFDLDEDSYEGDLLALFLNRRTGELVEQYDSRCSFCGYEDWDPEVIEGENIWGKGAGRFARYPQRAAEEIHRYVQQFGNEEKK